VVFIFYFLYIWRRVNKCTRALMWGFSLPLSSSLLSLAPSLISCRARACSHSLSQGVTCIYILVFEALSVALVLYFFVLGCTWSCTRPWASVVLLSLSLSGVCTLSLSHTHTHTHTLSLPHSAVVLCPTGKRDPDDSLLNPNP
jgi:hypothetical protein